MKNILLLILGIIPFLTLISFMIFNSNQGIEEKELTWPSKDNWVKLESNSPYWYIRFHKCGSWTSSKVVRDNYSRMLFTKEDCDKYLKNFDMDYWTKRNDSILNIPKDSLIIISKCK